MDFEFFQADDLARPKTDSLPPSIWVRPRCIVAIPAKDEEQRLPACLSALAAQRDRQGMPIVPGLFRVVMFANNCKDLSADIARYVCERLSLPIRVVEASVPPADAHAGNARRMAMDLAESWLLEAGADDGVILTTDADSRVSPDWITNNLAAIDAGADAVLGGLMLDEEGELLPPALHRRGRLEGAYEALLTELSALLDPRDHNPWPHHATISGASIAITREAYLRVGRMPRVPLGEDKALVAELVRHDAKIRYSPDVHVTTSARLVGRAPGGVADTLRLRSVDPSASCDELMEPFRIAIKRAKWRARLRCLRAAGDLVGASGWARELGINASEARRICRARTFGAAWSAVEANSPVLARRLLTPAELPDQIAGARRAVARLRKAAASLTDQHIEPKVGVPVGSFDPCRLPHGGDEEISSLVAG